MNKEDRRLLMNIYSYDLPCGMALANIVKDWDVVDYECLVSQLVGEYWE